MRKLILAAILALVAVPAWADGTIDTLSAGGALTGTELIPMFQTANPAVTTTPNAIITLLTGQANTWSAVQTFNNSDIKLKGSSTGATTFTSGNSGASNFTLTFPAVTDTLAVLGTAQTFTAAQTFNNSDIKLLGSSTGATTLTSANAGASNFTLTLPAVTDTLAVLGTSQSFTAGQAVTPTADGTQSAGGTLTMDFAASNYHTATFGAGNLTIANPSNIKAGECGWLALTQDSVGSRTATWGSDFKWSGATAPTLSTGANKVDLISWCAISTTVIAAQLAISDYR